MSGTLEYPQSAPGIHPLLFHHLLLLEPNFLGFKGQTKNNEADLHKRLTIALPDGANFFVLYA